MTTRWMGRNLWALLCLLPLAFANAAPADDLRSKGGCNVNGIDDACDLNCDDETCLKEIAPDTWIQIAGCGMSQDCDSDGIPDECDGQPRTVYYVDAEATAGNDTGVDWDNAYLDSGRSWKRSIARSSSLDIPDSNPTDVDVLGQA